MNTTSIDPPTSQNAQDDNCRPIRAIPRYRSSFSPTAPGPGSSPGRLHLKRSHRPSPSPRDFHRQYPQRSQWIHEHSHPDSIRDKDRIKIRFTLKRGRQAISMRDPSFTNASCSYTACLEIRARGRDMAYTDQYTQEQYRKGDRVMG